MNDSIQRLYTLFIYLFTEEYRHQTDVFGSVRFLLFPLIITGFVTGTAYAVTNILSTVSVYESMLGVLALCFVYGLQLGGVIFTDESTTNNVIEDSTRIIDNSQLIPVTPKTMTFMFLVKDTIVYSFLFFIPLAIAFVLAFSGISFFQFLSAILLSFILGIGVTILFGSLYYNSKVLGLLWLGSQIVLFFKFSFILPHSVFSGTILAPLLYTIMTLLFGGILYRPNYARSGKSRPREILFSNIHSKNSALLVKQMNDVVRSGGGIFKVFLGTVLMAGVAYGTVLLVVSATTVEPAYALVFVSFLTFVHYTTYTWVNHTDSLESYAIYPVEYEDLETAKHITFHVFAIITTIPIYIFLISITDITISTAIITFTIYFPLTEFYYRLTKFFAGHEPNEFLFDAVRFSAYGSILVIVYIPIFVSGLFNIHANVAYWIIYSTIVLSGVSLIERLRNKKVISVD